MDLGTDDVFLVAQLDDHLAGGLECTLSVHITQ